MQPKPKAISKLDVVHPIVGFPKAELEVEVKVTPKPLKPQVLEEVPKFRRVTHSNAKKATSSREKEIVIVELDPTKMKASSE